MIQLNSTHTECDIGQGLLLKVGQNIDYKPYEQKISVGKIAEFKYAPKSTSPWMKVTEIEDAKNVFWFSVTAWVDMYNQGMFKHTTTSKTLIDASTQPEDDDLPF